MLSTKKPFDFLTPVSMIVFLFGSVTSLNVSAYGESGNNSSDYSAQRGDDHVYFDAGAFFADLAKNGEHHHNPVCTALLGYDGSTGFGILNGLLAF